MNGKTVATIDDTDLEAIERRIYLLGRYLEETRFVLPAFVLAGVFYFASIRWLNDSTPGWVASALIVAVFGWDLFLTEKYFDVRPSKGGSFLREGFAALGIGIMIDDALRNPNPALALAVGLALIFVLLLAGRRVRIKP